MSTGKIALITGANKGIGKETAKQLAALGFTVLIGARDVAQGQAAADEVGHGAKAISLDVNREESIKAAAAQVEAAYGHLDILINNAGVKLGGYGQASTDIPTDEWRKTFETNLFGVIDVTRAFLPLLKKSEAGRIVNLSSILGSITLHADPKSPIYNSKPAAYDVSKSALNAFTVHLAFDLKDTAIKANAAHPGWVKTDMGGESAPMEIVDGAKTSVALATLPADGPTGGFFHLGKPLPW